MSLQDKKLKEAIALSLMISIRKSTSWMDHLSLNKVCFSKTEIKLFVLINLSFGSPTLSMSQKPAFH